MYDPKLGRFLQMDPIRYGDGMNGYQYAGGNPVNATDPSGLCRDAAGKYFSAPTGSRICEGHGGASIYGGIASYLSGIHHSRPRWARADLRWAKPTQPQERWLARTAQRHLTAQWITSSEGGV
jgi:hypothetical protein